VVPHGVSGLLFPEQDEAGGAAALIEAVASAERWPQWGRDGRAHVERHYSLATQVRALEAVYDELGG
jgi:glycosyltransferase involved in cell wall biosynthesis